MKQQDPCERRLPLALREVSPGEGFTRLSLSLGDGHRNGGVFLSPDGQDVWKPLDARPEQEAAYLVRTNEEEVLRLMAGRPGFPANWRIEEARGRRWLVRKRTHVVPEDFQPDWLSLEHILLVEQAVRALNAKRWSLGAPVRVAIDPERYDPFLLGLSAARPDERPDDAERFERWAEEVAGFDALAQLRRHARAVLQSTVWQSSPYANTHAYVYASGHRPIDSSWARIPDAVYVPADWKTTGVWTWVVAPGPLEPALVEGYELQWGFAPIAYE